MYIIYWKQQQSKHLQRETIFWPAKSQKLSRILTYPLIYISSINQATYYQQARQENFQTKICIFTSQTSNRILQLGNNSQWEPIAKLISQSGKCGKYFSFLFLLVLIKTNPQFYSPFHFLLSLSRRAHKIKTLFSFTPNIFITFFFLFSFSGAEIKVLFLVAKIEAVILCKVIFDGL